MKSCPTCNRTYADDTLTFCLDDGALLSAPYHDPQSTLQIPAARDTRQPTTEMLGASPTPVGPPSSSQPATARASGPYNQPREVVADPPAQRRGGPARMVVGGVIALLSVGVLILGYMLWRGNQNASSAVAKGDANVQANSTTGTPTPPVNSNINVNASGGETPKPTGDPNPRWLEGVWEGTGHQNTPKMTWTLKLTAENNAYAIEYPSLRCGGKWTLVEMGEGRAKFKEVITRGLERCSSDGDILIEKINDHQISYQYTLPFIGEVATATLSKK